MMGAAVAGEPVGSAAAGGVFGGLRTRLVVLVLVAVLPAFVILVRAAARQRDAILEAAGLDAQQHARVAATQVGEVFATARPYVELLAREEAVRHGDGPACTVLFRELLAADNRFRNIGLIGPDGSVLASAVDQPPGVNLKERSYFQRAWTSGRTSLGDFQIGKIHGEPSINLGAPVRDKERRITSVVFVAVKLDWLDEPGYETRRPADAAATLVGPGGLVMAHKPTIEGLVKSLRPDAPLVRAAGASREGCARIEGFDGVVRSWGWVPIRYDRADTGGWYAVGLSTAAAEARADAELRTGLLTLGLVAALALVIAWIAGDLLVVRRARRLVEVTGKIAAGDLTARVGGPSVGGEMGALARSVDAMAASLEEREAGLRRAEARYRSLVEQTPAVFYVGDTSQGERKPFERTVYAGPEVSSLFGFDADEWRARSNFWAERLHPEDRNRVFGEVSRVVGSPGVFSMEYRLLDRENHPVWVRDAGSARREGDAVRITGFLVDVTEVKALHGNLLRTGRLDAAGRVAAGVAKLVDESVAAAVRHARAAAPKVEADATARGHVEGIQRALDRLASLAADLRAFGGTEVLAPQAVDVNPALERLLPEIRNEAGPGVDVVTLLAPSVRPAWVDPRALDRAILRLAAHVGRTLREQVRREAGAPDGGSAGRLTIGTLDVLLDEGSALRAGVLPGSYVLIAFGDPRAPAADEAAPRSFEPFPAREAPAPARTGSSPGVRPGEPEDRLGLAAVFGFVRQSGGTAEAAGDPGRGTAWRLLLPCPR